MVGIDEGKEVGNNDGFHEGVVDGNIDGVIEGSAVIGSALLQLNNSVTVSFIFSFILFGVPNMICGKVCQITIIGEKRLNKYHLQISARFIDKLWPRCFIYI